jgi:type IV secretion system protein VirD4
VTGPASRRVDVPPLTWEVFAALATGWIVAATLLLPAGQGTAAALFGGGWVWPHGSPALAESIGGLLAGRPGAGLTARQATGVPGEAVVYPLVCLGEIALIGLTVWAGLAWWRLLGPGARDGMASRAEIRTVLGVSRLRRARKVIRPDLYGPAGRTGGDRW